MNIPPDPNDRMCMKCKGSFTPWSMGLDNEDPTPIPVNYVCITCRSAKVAA